MNIEQARTNMIKRQIETCDIHDERILNAIVAIPRENFVPERFKQLAFADVGIPLIHNQHMLSPLDEARLLSALNPQVHEKALLLTTGSGYLAAVLAQLCNSVYSIDPNADLNSLASIQFSELNIKNVNLSVGDIKKGWEEYGPFDVIAISASLPKLPDQLCQQLTIGGRLFVVLGTAPVMTATLIQRTSEHEWQEKALFETNVPMLANFVDKPLFTL